MEHFGTSNAYGNNSYIVNDPNAAAYHFQEQLNSTMPITPPMPMPVRNHQDMYSSYQPPYTWNPINDLNAHYYNEQWLTLSPPEPVIQATPLNQIPMDSSEFDMNHFDNNHLFLNPEMQNMDDEMMLNPMGMNATPPTFEIQYGGRMLPVTPIELHPARGFEHIMVHGPQMSGQPVLHAAGDSNNASPLQLTNKDNLPISSNNYANHTVDYQERNNQDFLPIPLDNNTNQPVEVIELDDQECNCQFCRAQPIIIDDDDDESMDNVDEANNNNNDNNVIVIDDDTDDDDNVNMDNNHDDDNDMNSEPGYEIHMAQGAQVVNILVDFDRLTYEQILAMQEEIGFVENGVPSNMLERALKRKKFLPSASSSSSSSNASCSICWDEFKVGQDVGVLKCGHEFCYDCIEKWLMTKKTCPLCRESVL